MKQVNSKIILCGLLVMTAGILCGAAGCGVGDVTPEYVVLTIKNGKVTGGVAESARSPIVETELQGDTLDVDIQMEFNGKGTYDFDIPSGAKKIRLFGCDYDLPPPDHTAYFRAVMMKNIPGSVWKLQKEEIQYAMALVSVAPDRKNFDVQIRYKVSSGTEMWIREQNHSCLAAEDGQIFEILKPEEKESMSPGTHYWESGKCVNQGGNLLIQLETTGRFYKYLSKRSLVFNKVELPKPDFRPYTTFSLNMPYKEKYLEKNQSSEIFKVKKSVAEFRLLAEKIKFLRRGMTPEETAAILGPPDGFSSSGTKGPNTKSHGYADYFFLNTGSSNTKNLIVTLCFEKDPEGVFRLKEVW